MKSLRAFILATVFLACSVFSYAQTVDEIVEKHIHAIGGKEAWKKVNSLHVTGVLNVQGTDVNIQLVQLHGKGMRQDIEVQGVSGFQIVTPTEGWTFMPFQGQKEVTAMSQEDVKMFQNELDTHGSLIDYKEKGHIAELAGKETINGSETFKLIITLNSGKKETVFIDSKTFHIVRSMTTQKMNGQEEQLETSYNNFERTPDGIVVARSLVLPYGTMTLSKIEVNKQVNELMFSPTSDKADYAPR